MSPRMSAGRVGVPSTAAKVSAAKNAARTCQASANGLAEILVSNSVISCKATSASAMIASGCMPKHIAYQPGRDTYFRNERVRIIPQAELRQFGAGVLASYLEGR